MRGERWNYSKSCQNFPSGCNFGGANQTKINTQGRGKPVKTSPNLVLPYSRYESEVLLGEAFRKDTLYKTQSQILAPTLRQINLIKQAERTEQCNSWKKFESCAADPDHTGKKIVAANYCRNRFCATCQWLKSRKLFRESMTIGEHILTDDPSLRFLFLTLTVPNLPLSELGNGTTDMMEAWKRLTQRRRVQSILLGFHRSLEVTYNPQTYTYHPHFHALLVVPSGYFGKNYINQSEWLTLWREATRNKSITQVDVRAVKPKPINTKRVSEWLEKVKHLSEEDQKKTLKMLPYVGGFAEACKYSVKEWSLSKIGNDGRRKGATLSVKDERILRKALMNAQLDFGLPGHIWIRNTIEESGEVLDQLRSALLHRRLVHPGGIIAEAKRELKLTKDEDDIDEDEEQGEEESKKKKKGKCSKCGCDIVERTAFWESFYNRFTGDKSFQGRYVVPTTGNFEIPY